MQHAYWPKRNVSKRVIDGMGVQMITGGMQLSIGRRTPPPLVQDVYLKLFQKNNPHCKPNIK
jgi:hypothetical protein